MKRTICAVVALVATSGSTWAAEWHAWGVHGGTISEAGGVITAVTGASETHHWNKGANWVNRVGKKAFYSTDDFLDRQVGDITTITWDVLQGQAKDVYFNIVVTDGAGHKAILIPAVNGNLFGSASHWGAGATFKLVEPDVGWAGPATDTSLAWSQVENLAISTGPFNDEPDNIAGDATGPSDPVYNTGTWAAWADLAAGGDFGWEDDGFLIVFGQSTLHDVNHQISNLSVVIPEPAALSLIAIGGAAMLLRRRA